MVLRPGLCEDVEPLVLTRVHVATVRRGPRERGVSDQAGVARVPAGSHGAPAAPGPRTRRRRTATRRRISSPLTLDDGQLLARLIALTHEVPNIKP
jgi:hypothetical protein